MLRTFTDQAGTSWDVFEVHPGSGRTVSRVPVEYRLGWLCFQSLDERRRLAPIPEDWKVWEVDGLIAALKLGDAMPRRTPRAFDAQTPAPRTSGEAMAQA